MPDTPQTGQAFYRIGEVASRLGIKESCVRYYRKVLYPILKPIKHNGKHFAYSQEDLQILRLFVALVRKDIGNLFEVKALLQKLLRECDNDPFKVEATHPEFFFMDTLGVREEGSAIVEEARREALELKRALDENIRRVGKLQIKVAALKQEVKRLRQRIKSANSVAQEILESVR